ncbi:DUF2252 family protein [Bdellovibrio sp. HCB337]|uniref:DUF2252 family protein n=1 Tax=Bdellovibrio sp. HCB337 TaxID=3394358 RepID=UPI0039A419C5
MASTVLACALVFTLNGTAAQSVGPKDIPFQQVELSKNISQLLRSNSGHYWKTAATDVSRLGDLSNYIQEQGTINGDPHLGNFSVIPITSKKGKEELKFLNIDFDDGGRGPFALEFARYVAVGKASSKDIKVKDLCNAYLSGLRGEKMKEPATIRDAESITSAEYAELRTKYVQKRVSGNKFKEIPGEIEKWDGHPNKEDVSAVIKNYEVLDVAKRPMERGGSLGSLRLWVLVKDKSGNKRILELKEYQETSLAEYQAQPEMNHRVADLFETYWRKTDPSSYTLEKVFDRVYWVREKKVTVLEYQDKVQEDEARIYIANLIGRFQARQAEGAAYLAKIEKDPTRFKEAVKAFIKDYLGTATAAME